MKRLFTTFLIMLIALSYSFAIQPPAITLVPLITNSFCVGSLAGIGFIDNTYPSGRFYAVQLSDSNGSFSGTPTILGTGQSSPITFTLPSFSSGNPSNYVLRVIDQNDNTRVSGSSTAIYFGTLSVKLQTVGGQTYTDICNGSSVKLYAATNFPDKNYFTYYWYKDGNSIPNGSMDSYTTNQTGVYQVRAQRYGCDGFVSTNYFNVRNINNLSGENYLFGNDFSPFQCTGMTIPFKSVYEAENATYQWKKDGVVMGGETKSILNITQSGAYTLTVTDANCSAPSSYTLTKNLTFGNVINTLISSNNDSISFCANNQNVSLSYSNNLTNSASYSYQWKKNGVDIVGANQININNLSAGTYSLKVTQGNCSAMSNSIFVNSTNVSSKVIGTSYGTNACIGDKVSLYVAGLSCSTYQWQKDEIDIPQAIGTYYEAIQSGSYRVKLIENGLTSYSNSINVNISDTQNYIISEGRTECFPIKPYYYSYSNSYPFDGRTFQWYKNDVPISGATNYNYDITSSGTYKLKVTKGSCGGFSQNEVVVIPTVKQLSKPQITDPYGSVACSNNYLNLQSTYFSNFSNANYEWKKNGQTVLSQLDKYVFEASESGSYTVTVTKSTCTATSDPFIINIGEKQQSIKNSNWNDATMWSCGTAPTISEDILINKGHTVSIPNNYTGFVRDLQLNGILQYGNNALLKSRTN